MIKNRTQRLTVTSMLLALGLILPFATAHGIGIPGTVLLPMHIPVFLAGLLCGPVFGAAAGLVLPGLNTLLTGMPAAYPMLPIMTAELFTYGAISGILQHKTPLCRRKWGVYISLVAAMLAGRVSYGIVAGILVLFGLGLGKVSVITAVVTGIPGIIIQLLLVPAVVITLGYASGTSRQNLIESSKNLITSGKASCVVIRGGVIVATENARGIAPILEMYDKGFLKDAVVVDRIIGLAAANILVLGGARACYGQTMSVSARDFLTSHGIRTECSTLTDHIVNRSGDGICPMEMAVSGATDPEEAVLAIRQTLDRLRITRNDK